MEPATKTPLLHRKLEQILEVEDLIPGRTTTRRPSNSSSPSRRTSSSRPPPRNCAGWWSGLLQLEKHGGIRVLVRKDLYGRSVSVVVALPRDRFNAALRKRLQQFFLERFQGLTVDYHLSLGETESARIFFTVHLAPGSQIPEVPYEALETEVEKLARSWDDDLKDALMAGSVPSGARCSPRSTRHGSPATTRPPTSGGSSSTTCWRSKRSSPTPRASSWGSATRARANASRA